MRSVYEAVSLPWTWRYSVDPFQQKAHFQKHESDMLPSRVPYQRTAVCSALPCHPFRSSIHRLRSAVFSVLQEDRSRGKGSTSHVNTFPMIRWVLRRMHDSGWTLLPNDKQPGFSFNPDSETRDIPISSLAPGSYTETRFDGVQIPGLMKAYSVIAKGVGGLHGKRAQSAVFSSQWCEGAKAMSQIRLLCKTTKGSWGGAVLMCALSSIEHVDRFIGMAGTPPS